MKNKYFTNSKQEDFEILASHKDTYLLVDPWDTATPYIVATGVNIDWNEWDMAAYYKTLENALISYEKEVYLEKYGWITR